MANNMQRILRRPEVEQSELELARSRSLTRLAAMVDGDTTHGADEAVIAASPQELIGSDEGLEVTEAHDDTHDLLTAVRPRSMVADGALEAEAGGAEDGGGPRAEAAYAEESRPPVVVVGDPSEPGPSEHDLAVDAGDTAQDTLFQDYQPLASSLATEPPAEDVPEALAVEVDLADSMTASIFDDGPAADADMTTRFLDAEAEGATGLHAEGPAPVAYCPNCATVLEPPPETTRRCARCRHKIVVRHVGARTVYLAEAALPVFEAEQRRLAEVARWITVRDFWLELAARHGATDDRVDKITREEASEARASAARALYISSVDRSFESAVHHGRWQDAARVRYDQALVLFEFAGAPAPARPDAEPADQAEAAAAD